MTEILLLSFSPCLGILSHVCVLLGERGRCESIKEIVLSLSPPFVCDNTLNAPFFFLPVSQQFLCILPLCDLLCFVGERQSHSIPKIIKDRQDADVNFLHFEPLHHAFRTHQIGQLNRKELTHPQKKPAQNSQTGFSISTTSHGQSQTPRLLVRILPEAPLRQRRGR